MYLIYWIKTNKIRKRKLQVFLQQKGRRKSNVVTIENIILVIFIKLMVYSIDYFLLNSS